MSLQHQSPLYTFPYAEFYLSIQKYSDKGINENIDHGRSKLHWISKDNIFHFTTCSWFGGFRFTNSFENILTADTSDPRKPSQSNGITVFLLPTNQYEPRRGILWRIVRVERKSELEMSVNVSSMSSRNVSKCRYKLPLSSESGGFAENLNESRIISAGPTECEKDQNQSMRYPTILSSLTKRIISILRSSSMRRWIVRMGRKNPGL